MKLDNLRQVLPELLLTICDVKSLRKAMVSSVSSMLAQRLNQVLDDVDSIESEKVVGIIMSRTEAC